MPARDDVLAANARFAAGFDAGDLPAPPSRGLAVVTCMDARIDPPRALGFSVGEAHVIRNAGAAVTGDVLRSLAVSHHLLGTREVLVIAHEECGMHGLHPDALRERAGGAADGLELHAFADLDEHVREGVRRIRESPLLRELDAWGYVYDVRTGRLREVP